MVMDINLTLLSGRLAVPPMVETQPDGSKNARLLVYLRSQRRNRFDVIPVVVPEPVGSLATKDLGAGTSIYVSGALMRVCSPEGGGASTRIEVVADAYRLPDDEDVAEVR
jgi:hypothetical protein